MMPLAGNRGGRVLSRLIAENPDSSEIAGSRVDLLGINGIAGEIADKYFGFDEGGRPFSRDIGKQVRGAVVCIREDKIVEEHQQHGEYRRRREDRQQQRKHALARGFDRGDFVIARHPAENPERSGKDRHGDRQGNDPAELDEKDLQHDAGIEPFGDDLVEEQDRLLHDEIKNDDAERGKKGEDVFLNDITVKNHKKKIV